MLLVTYKEWHEIVQRYALSFWRNRAFDPFAVCFARPTDGTKQVRKVWLNRLDFSNVAAEWHESIFRYMLGFKKYSDLIFYLNVRIRQTFILTQRHVNPFARSVQKSLQAINF